MPHLSPMHWLITIATFLFTLSLTISLMWWHSSPKFPHVTSTTSSPSMKWYW